MKSGNKNLREAIDPDPFQPKRASTRDLGDLISGLVRQEERAFQETMSRTMEPFYDREGQLYCGELPFTEIADRYGTPLDSYSQNAILGTFNALKRAFAEVDPLICYSVKANSNLGIRKMLAEHGRGFDVVLAGELHRVLQAGGNFQETVLAGVGKTDEEIQAGLEAGVLMFNVD